MSPRIHVAWSQPYCIPLLTTISRAQAHQSNFDDRYLSSIRGQPIKILRHQSAGHSNRCMKPVQSLFSLVFQRLHYVRLAASHITLARRCCFEFFLSCFPTEFWAKERLLAVYGCGGAGTHQYTDCRLLNFLIYIQYNGLPLWLV